MKFRVLVSVALIALLVSFYYLAGDKETGGGLPAAHKTVPLGEKSEPIAAPEPALAERAEAEIAPKPEKSPAQWLFSAPKNVTGTELNSTTARYGAVVNNGKPEGGRQGEVQPATFADPKTLSVGQKVTLPLLDGRPVEGAVQLVKAGREGWTRASGTLDGTRGGTFVLASNGSEVAGLVQLPREGVAYEIKRERDGRTLMIERLLSEVICSPLPPYVGGVEFAPASTPQAAVPLLNSRPNAVEVLYLDFDGEYVTDSSWNGGVPIDAEAYDLSSTVIENIFKRVKEDWIPFNVNVTTDAGRYWNAPPGHRMRCIITPTKTAAPTAGGVAYLNSFRLGNSTLDDDVPCWVFNATEASIAEAISHEFGHTMGLSHDGRTNPAEDYYAGHDNWAPIMGVGYDKAVVQWSRGEYTGANQKQDDLAIITATYNHFGYAQDLAGNTRETAAPLTIVPQGAGTIGSIEQAGTIERGDDSDFYQFATNGGALNIAAQSAPLSPNLSYSLQLYDGSGSIIATTPPDRAPGLGYLNLWLPRGVYFLRVINSGYVLPTRTVYSNYGSLGDYTLTGNLENVASTLAIISPPAVRAKKGVYFAYPIKASGNAASYGVEGVLPAGLTLDPSSGVISGVPLESGEFSLTISVANSASFASSPLALSISEETVTLAQSLDAQAFVWSSGSEASWVGQFTVTTDGTDAAQSGALANAESSYVETAVKGPVTVAWKWKVSSEQDGDFLAVQVDGLDVAAISGEVDWQDRQTVIPAGLHTLRWVYRKNSSVVRGLDLAWVDQVTFADGEAPVITSETGAAGTVGEAFAFTIAADHFPTGFAIVSGTLPAGVTLDAASGVIQGVPAAPGTFYLTVKAENVEGEGTGSLQIVVAPTPYTIGQALDLETVAWTLTGDADWFPQTQVKYAGAHALQAGPIGAGQSTTVSMTVQAPVSVNFYWKTDCESGTATTGDSLNCAVDGLVAATISGSVDWYSQTVFVSGTGPRTVSWTYRKDEETSQGADTAWLDRVIITTDVLPVVSSASVSGRQGTSFYYRILATNSPDAYEADPLPAGLSLNPETGVISGNPEVSGTFPITLRAINQAGAGTGSLTLTLAEPMPSLAAALNAETLVWTTGAVPWLSQDAVTYDGVAAARSGVVKDNQSSYIETQVTGPADVSFYWRTDSQSGGTSPYSGDSLRFTIDGVTEGFIKGNTGWQARTASLPPGEHKLRWTYLKDSSGKAGEDAAWLDRVAISRESSVPQITSPLSVRAFIGRAFRYQIAGTHGPTSFSANPLPAGLELDTATGLITGSPQVAGATDVAVDASNLSGTDHKTIRIEVGVESAGADLFANATALTGTFVKSVGTNAYATADSGEPPHAGYAASASVWWAWTAPSTGEVSVTTEGSSFDTRLSVFAGDSLANLTLIKTNDDSGRLLTSAVKFKAVGGQVYHIAVDGLTGATGEITLNIAYTATAKYAGLLLDQADLAEPGLATLDLTGKFTFSGVLQFGKKKHSFKGAFVDGTYSGTINRGRDVDPIAVHLEVDFAAGGDQIIGTAELDGVTYEFAALRAISKTDLAPELPGPFTFVIEPDDTTTVGLPRGLGYGTVVIDKSGKAKTMGKLGDGAKFSFSVPVSGDRTWPLYLAPYRLGGVCVGQMVFDAGSSPHSVGAALHWRKEADAKADLFPDGFPATTATLTGFRYAKPAAGEKIIPVLAGPDNLQITFQESDLAALPDVTGTLDDKNKFSGGPARFKLSFVTSSGLFSGSFLGPDGNAHAFSGAVVLSDYVVDPGGPSPQVITIPQGLGQFTGLKTTGTVVVAPAQ